MSSLEHLLQDAPGYNGTLPDLDNGLKKIRLYPELFEGLVRLGLWASVSSASLLFDLNFGQLNFLFLYGQFKLISFMEFRFNHALRDMDTDFGKYPITSSSSS